MQELLLVNPRKRTTRRKPRTAAQKAATRKMIAANRRRRNPTPARKRAENPAPKRRRSYTRTVRTVRRARRHNPIGGNAVTGLLMSAFSGAAGAAVVNAGYNYLPIPATLKTGYTGYAVKGGMAILLGLFGKKFLGRRATKMAEGSLTVTMSQLIADVGAKAGMNLGYYSPAVQYMPRRVQPTQQHMPQNQVMSEYLSEYVSGDGMGEYVQ